MLFSILLFLSPLLVNVLCDFIDYCMLSIKIRLIVVQIPQSLSKKDGYDHREALFGVPPYGGSIQQNLFYADSDLCNSQVDTNNLLTF
jgi:hypothetical protein